MEHKKCPLCGGMMINGTSCEEGYNFYFWRAPWRKGLLKTLKGDGAIKASPWLCFNCGVVLPFISLYKLQKLRKELGQLQQAEREKLSLLDLQTLIVQVGMIVGLLRLKITG